MKRTIKCFLCLALCAALMPSLSAWAQTPVFTASAALSTGASETTFSVYATDALFPDGDGAFVYRVEYVPAGEAAKRELTFPCYGETEVVPLLRFVDLNFDGHLDLEALYVSGATNTWCTYFLNGGDDAGFTRAPIFDNLSSYDLYAEQRVIVNYEHESAASGVYTVYRCAPGAFMPYVCRVASFLTEYDEATQTLSYRDFAADYDEAGNETVILDEKRNADFDDATWQTWYDARMAFLWNDLNANETPVRR